jgi:rod shape-determining protein MreD
MRWLTFLIFAYLTVCVQFALSGTLGWADAAPNLVLLLAVFLALHAGIEAALVGCFLLGLLFDVVSPYGLGTHAVVFGVLGFIVYQLRAVMYREHPMTHLTLGALIGFAYVMLLFFRQWLRSFVFDEPSQLDFRSLMLGVLTTTLAAPIAIYFLRRVRRVFAFNSSGG